MHKVKRWILFSLFICFIIRHSFGAHFYNWHFFLAMETSFILDAEYTVEKKSFNNQKEQPKLIRTLKVHHISKKKRTICLLVSEMLFELWEEEKFEKPQLQLLIGTVWFCRRWEKTRNLKQQRYRWLWWFWSEQQITNCAEKATKHRISHWWITSAKYSLTLVWNCFECSIQLM